MKQSGKKQVAAASVALSKQHQHLIQRMLATSMSSSSVAPQHARLQRDVSVQSPVTRVHFRDQCVHVKRDDVFHLAGNKMRKLHWFVAQDDEFYKDAHLFSFGGTQSNAMLAIAQLAHAKRVPFTYFSRGLQLQGTTTMIANESEGGCSLDLTAIARPHGNLALALELGMQHIKLSSELYHALAQTKDFSALSEFADNIENYEKRAVHIPQGAAFEQAQQGLALLAHEINAYIASERLTHPEKLFSVVVPCGTGTTALYMAQHLDASVAKLYAVPCVGDAAYLEQQFEDLVQKDASLRALKCDSTLKLPIILVPKRKSRFGRLWWPLYEIHHELLSATGIEFDLIYGAFAWRTMFDDATLPLLLGKTGQSSHNDDTHQEGNVGNADPTNSGEQELMYVHTGGVSGNATMLARYSAKSATRRH